MPFVKGNPLSPAPLAVLTVLACLSTATSCRSPEPAQRDEVFARVATRHRVSFVMPLPRKYVDEIRRMPGVTAVTWARWFGGRSPTAPDVVFAAMAVDPQSYTDVYPDIEIDPDALSRWRRNRRGAIVDEDLAHKLGWKVGDRVTLNSTAFPGTWQFDIAAIVPATSAAPGQSMFLFHWGYLDDSLPAAEKDQVGWIVSRVDDPPRAVELPARIDRTLGQGNPPTRSHTPQKCARGRAGGRPPGRFVCMDFDGKPHLRSEESCLPLVERLLRVDPAIGHVAGVALDLHRACLDELTDDEVACVAAAGSKQALTTCLADWTARRSKKPGR